MLASGVGSLARISLIFIASHKASSRSLCWDSLLCNIDECQGIESDYSSSHQHKGEEHRCRRGSADGAMTRGSLTENKGRPSLSPCQRQRIIISSPRRSSNFPFRFALAPFRRSSPSRSRSLVRARSSRTHGGRFQIRPYFSSFFIRNRFTAAPLFPRIASSRRNGSAENTPQPQPGNHTIITHNNFDPTVSLALSSTSSLTRLDSNPIQPCNFLSFSTTHHPPPRLVSPRLASSPALPRRHFILLRRSASPRPCPGLCRVL